MPFTPKQYIYIENFKFPILNHKSNPDTGELLIWYTKPDTHHRFIDSISIEGKLEDTWEEGVHSMYQIIANIFYADLEH